MQLYQWSPYLKRCAATDRSFSFTTLPVGNAALPPKACVRNKMRPTSIKIVGRSALTYNQLVQRDLRYGLFPDLVSRLHRGSEIFLSKKIATADDVQPLVDYLVRRGIPRSDIRLRYPELEVDQLLRSKLAVGLAQSGLTFGADVAEHDAGLSRYFISTQSFQAIKAGKRHLVVGPKGSGKSAILQVLLEDLKDPLVITPEHYATDVLDSLAKSHLSTELSAYITTWKYTLLIEIFQRLTHSFTTAGVAEIRRLYGRSRAHEHERVFVRTLCCVSETYNKDSR